MIGNQRRRWTRPVAVAVAVLVFPVLASVALPSASAQNTNYATRARALVNDLTSATTDEAAFDVLMEFFETANITIVGERNGAMETINQGFGFSTRRDFFLMEDSVLALASAFRADTTASISELSAAANLFMKPKATPKEMAAAVVKWVKFGRAQAADKPTDARLLFPYFIDQLAKKDGVDLARGKPKTEFPGLGVYLALVTLAPQKSALQSSKARARAAAFDPCGMLNEFTQGSGLGAAIGRGLGWALGFVKKAVVKVAPVKILDSLRGAAVALMTKITPTPESIPLGGPPQPLHWRHFDDPAGQSSGTPDPKKYELTARSDIPISESASNCMELLGIDVPAEGEARPEIPVIWWLDDGTAPIPELRGQRLFDQGEWEYVGPNAGGIPGISDAASAVTSKLPIGGQILGLGATDSTGKSTTEFTPRDEEGPYEEAFESHVEGKLRAFPLTGGLGSPAEIGASVISAITKRLEWSVKVHHHVKLGWMFDAAPVSWAIPCEGDGCPIQVQWQVSGVRCQFPQVDQWWDQSARSLTQVPIDGLWFAQWFQSYNPGFPFTTAQPFQVGKVGESTNMGTPDNELDPREGHGFLTTRLPDDASKASVRLEYYDPNEDGDIVKWAENTADITPISRASELEAVAAVQPSATGCVPKETIRTP